MRISSEKHVFWDECIFFSLIMNMQILNISNTDLRIRDEMGIIVSLSKLADGFLKLNAELVTHTQRP